MCNFLLLSYSRFSQYTYTQVTHFRMSAHLNCVDKKQFCDVLRKSREDSLNYFVVLQTNMFECASLFERAF